MKRIPTTATAVKEREMTIWMLIERYQRDTLLASERINFRIFPALLPHLIQWFQPSLSPARNLEGDIPKCFLKT